MSIEKSEKPLGMKWYNFLIYFGLFAGAVINFIYGLLGYLTGRIWLVTTNHRLTIEEVYAYYPGLQTVDIMFGLFLVGFAIFAIVLRQKLAHYKPEAPKFVYIFYTLSAVIPFLYSVLVYVIVGVPFSVDDVVSLLIGILILCLNIRYFKRRKHLFVGEAPVQHSIPSQCKNENTSTYVSRPNTNRPPQISDPNAPPTPYDNYGVPLNELALDKTVSIDADSIVNTAKNVQNIKIAYCRKCGTELMSDSEFCHKCGEKVVIPPIKEETPAEVSAVARAVQNQDEKLKICEQKLETEIRKNKISKIAIILVCVVLIVLCVLPPLIKSINESYAWKVTVLGWNSDEYSSTYQSSISKYEPVYCHIKVTGGAPGENTRIRVSGTLPNGEGFNYTFDEFCDNGWIGWYGWTDGIYIDPEYGDNGIIRIYFYDDAGNEIGRSSIRITE